MNDKPKDEDRDARIGRALANFDPDAAEKLAATKRAERARRRDRVGEEAGEDGGMLIDPSELERRLTRTPRGKGIRELVDADPAQAVSVLRRWLGDKS